jgi:hypothetical protein
MLPSRFLSVSVAFLGGDLDLDLRRGGERDFDLDLDLDLDLERALGWAFAAPCAGAERAAGLEAGDLDLDRERERDLDLDFDLERDLDRALACALVLGGERVRAGGEESFFLLEVAESAALDLGGVRERERERERERREEEEVEEVVAARAALGGDRARCEGGARRGALRERERDRDRD